MRRGRHIRTRRYARECACKCRRPSVTWIVALRCVRTWEAQSVFARVAIVNRGEAAMRLIHAVRELSAETGARIETVALYTDADKSATFVREADLAYPLGPAAAPPARRPPSARPYLDLGVLERALLETEADAAWVGWGFVAEDPAFAELCEKLGVTFVGPR